jgi:hypothetical protein
VQWTGILESDCANLMVVLQAPARNQSMFLSVLEDSYAILGGRSNFEV